MSRIRSTVLPLLILALTCAGAWWLLREPPASEWVRVQASSEATAGAPYVATATLLREPVGAYIHLDLHGYGPRGAPLRCVAVGGAQPLVSGASDFTYRFTVPRMPELEQLRAIIYTTRTGRWSDHVQVAASEPVRLAPPGEARTASTAPLRVVDQRSDPAITLEDPLWLRSAVGVLWIACAVIVAQPGRQGSRSRRARFLLFLLVILALVEFTGAGSILANSARALALDHGWYDDRRRWQQLFSAVCLAALALVTTVSLRRTLTAWPTAVVLGAGVYVCASIVALLSLHEVDRLLASGFGSVPVSGMVRLFGAALVTFGMLRCRHTRPGAAAP